jgi:hypothetical protein
MNGIISVCCYQVLMTVQFFPNFFGLQTIINFYSSSSWNKCINHVTIQITWIMILPPCPPQQQGPPWLLQRFGYARVKGL